MICSKNRALANKDCGSDKRTGTSKNVRVLRKTYRHLRKTYRHLRSTCTFFRTHNLCLARARTEAASTSISNALEQGIICLLAFDRKSIFPTDRFSFWLRRRRPTRNQVTVALLIEYFYCIVRSAASTGLVEAFLVNRFVIFLVIVELAS